MTTDGWKPLHPRDIIPAPMSEDRYRGPLPSPQFMAFLRWLETEALKQRNARLLFHAEAA
jgi:hypothetical protein